MKESVKFFEAMRDFASVMLEAEKADSCDCKCEKAESEKKTTKKTEKKEERKDSPASYEDMNTKELYKLCCDRGISSKVKSRKKVDLIEALEKYDNGDFNEDAEENDDWDEEEEQEKEVDQYEGKTAKELYKMCVDRGIKAKTKQEAEAYVKLLKKDDEEQEKASQDVDDEDDWEF